MCGKPAVIVYIKKLGEVPMCIPPQRLGKVPHPGGGTRDPRGER